MSAGDKVKWVSNKGRTRTVRIVTAMRSSAHHLVEILEGLPCEGGRHHVVPTARLHP